MKTITKLGIAMAGIIAASQISSAKILASPYSPQDGVTTPHVTLNPVIEFINEGDVWKEEEKTLYVDLFNKALSAQDTGKIPLFFYSDNDTYLEKLTMTKVITQAGAGAAHMGTSLKIIDNTIHAGLPNEDFFYHEFGHLVTYMDHWNCCGAMMAAEGVANVVRSELQTSNPRKIVFGETIMYDGTAFADRWYEHAERWNMPVIYQDTNSIVREDREFAYIFLTLLYYRIRQTNFDGMDINKSDAIINYALANTAVLRDRSSLANAILPVYEIGDCIILHAESSPLQISGIDIYGGIVQYTVTKIDGTTGHVPIDIGNKCELCPKE